MTSTLLKFASGLFVTTLVALAAHAYPPTETGPNPAVTGQPNVNQQTTPSATGGSTSGTTTPSGEMAPAPTVAAPAPIVVVPDRGSGMLRLTPFFGFGSADSDGVGDVDINRNTSFGAWLDFGRSFLTFQTGFSFDQNDVDVAGRTVPFDTWGVPLMMKLNFSGQPNSTVYLKGGFNFVDEQSVTLDYIDTVGVLGLGANIPLGSNAAALLLEGNYINLLTREGFASDMEGLKFFAGVSIRL